MSAGTLTLTNKSAAVSGSGTAFTTELAAGDFIVVTVGGVPYTFPVKSVESGTALMLVSNYTGPTQSGAAWSAVPRVALNMVTAALVAQSAEAMRGLNYDKQNWQSIFSGSGNVTVKLPDGSSFTGPAWGGIATTLDGKAGKGANNDITSLEGLTTALGLKYGGTGANTASGARAKLELGTAATKNTGYAIGNVITVGAFGIGTSAELLSNTDLGSATSGCRFFMNGGGGFWSQWGCGVKLAYFDTHNFQIYQSGNNGSIVGLVQNHLTGQIIFANHYSDKNTTIDTNGNLKPASPVVKLKGDGTAELNEEAEGVMTERIDTGIYKISGVLGFHSEPIWGGVDGGFVIPANTNGLPLLWVDYEIDPDGSITLKTYHRTHHSAPEFARNLIGIKNEDGSFTETVQDGEPVDIPAGRWVDLRVEMPRNSLWNIKQQAVQEAMEIAERERQQNQQDTQS
ncbi:phage tail protein [Citrobacter freundii]|uniref:phage tail fiber protein n=1 Tax=Citrobacter freundii complex TaxID=1344959 RepID=UPI0024E16E67|nr:phage tail protein [Citrobacter freundii]MDV0628439.1 phage tail protein [Citrobacter freundii]MDV0633702.1 phage tail protein [Citrobacter freundii]MDV0644846.1 phage tail protein [Citrobacter freundii]MDV0665216.1 phage tail protein [Citrobacter freundii]MDV0670323.1 phage tail protein [Citrobacter freundii]